MWGTLKSCAQQNQNVRAKPTHDSIHRVSILTLALTSAIATADPGAVTADTSVRTSGDASISYGGFGTANSLVSVALERTWGRRLHTALRLGAGGWGIASTVVTEETLEIGAQLRPSDSLGLLLGWRVGHAYFKKQQFGFDDTSVSTFAVEPVARLSFALGTRWSLRFMPITLNFYKNRVWALTIGSEIGISRRF